MASNTKLKTFIQRFKMSQQFSMQKAMEAILNNADVIEQMNKGQMLRGVDANGNQLGDYGELRTGQRIIAGKQVGFIDLNFTGEFQESIEARPQKFGNNAAVFIQAQDPKWQDIQTDDRFDEALGLTAENRDKVGLLIAQHIRNELLKYYQV